MALLYLLMIFYIIGAIEHFINKEILIRMQEIVGVFLVSLYGLQMKGNIVIEFIELINDIIKQNITKK